MQVGLPDQLLVLTGVLLSRDKLSQFVGIVHLRGYTSKGIVISQQYSHWQGSQVAPQKGKQVIYLLILTGSSHHH